jgi:hypothetical protein
LNEQKEGRHLERSSKQKKKENDSRKLRRKDIETDQQTFLICFESELSQLAFVLNMSCAIAK